MSRTQFGPGRKGRLSKLLRNLYYCQSRQTPIPTPPIPTIPFSGSGFTYTFENNTYTIVFKNNGTITFTNDYLIEYVIVGGGGGGGGAGTNLSGFGGGGGGGGGGQVINNFQNVTGNQVVNVIIGDGGAGGIGNLGNGANGQQTTITSSLFTIAANGGIAGLGGTLSNGGKGGNSGGGGSGGIGSFSPNTQATNGTNGGGGGGGGYNKIQGRNGAINNIIGLSIYGAGGGGGKGYESSGPGSRGNIYAGNGGTTFGQSATSNYGGGGGGGGAGNPVNYSGGNGGSGLAILYLTILEPTPDPDPQFNTCFFYENCFCIQEKVNQIKNGYNDPTQPQSFRVAQLANQRLGGRTTFGNVGLGLGVGVNARTNTYLGGLEGQPGGSPRPLRNRF